MGGGEEVKNYRETPAAMSMHVQQLVSADWSYLEQWPAPRLGGPGSAGRWERLRWERPPPPPADVCSCPHWTHLSGHGDGVGTWRGGEESEAIRLLQGCAPNQCRRNLWKASLFHLTVAPSFDPDWKYSHTTLLRVSSARASKSAKHSI